jgi:hypothetical protein
MHVKITGMYHILPIDDIGTHIESSMCTCNPMVKQHSGEMICVHNSFDGREFLEKAQEAKRITAKLNHFTDYLRHLSDLIENKCVECECVSEIIRHQCEVVFDLTRSK